MSPSINSTIWRERKILKVMTAHRMTSDPAPDSEVHAAWPSADADFSPDRRRVLLELEASLRASHRALLERDLSRLRECTSTHILLQRALAASAAPKYNPPDAAEVRALQNRILHLGRVQMALLSRAERWLGIVSNLVA